MSLVNQMLQDLEQRRTVSMGVSALGGLSASGVNAHPPPVKNIIGFGFKLLLLIVVVFSVVHFLQSTLTEVNSVNGNVDNFTKNAVESPVLNKPISGASVNAVLFEPIKSLEDGKAVGAVDFSTEIAEISDDINKLSEDVKLALSVITVSRQETSKKRDLLQKQGSVDIQEPLKSSAKFLVKNHEEVADNNATINQSVSMSTNMLSIPAVVNSMGVSDFSTSTHSKNVDQDTNVLPEERVTKTVLPLSRQQQANIAFQRAVNLMGRGDQLYARLALEEALAYEPSNVRARETLSALLLNAGRVSEAAEKLIEGLRLQPESAPLAKLYARVLMDQGNNETALGVLERAQPNVTKDTEYFSLLAALYRGVGKYAQASRVYQEILVVKPGVATWWMGLGMSQDAMGESIKALAAYQQAYRAGGLTPEVIRYVDSRISALKTGLALLEAGKGLRGNKVISSIDGFGDVDSVDNFDTDSLYADGFEE